MKRELTYMFDNPRFSIAVVMGVIYSASLLFMVISLAVWNGSVSFALAIIGSLGCSRIPFCSQYNTVDYCFLSPTTSR
jgi:hypothetical protein